MLPSLNTAGITRTDQIREFRPDRVTAGALRSSSRLKTATDQGKPREIEGRKATGLRLSRAKIAGPPERNPPWKRMRSAPRSAR